MDLKSLLFSDDEISSTSSSCSSNSEDGEDCLNEYLFLHTETTEGNKIKKNQFDDFYDCSNADFIEKYRVSRHLFEEIDSNWKISMEYKSLTRTHHLTSSTKHLAVFLWFAGHGGCSYRDLSDTFCLSLWTVNKIICRVSVFISNMLQNVITWPNNNTQLKTADYYRSVKKIPHVMGIIGTTHCKIDHPRKNVDDYINENGEYSIVLQGICDENKNFIDVSLGYPGALNESQILKKSRISEKQYHSGLHLVGGTEYPCLEWLIVPYKCNERLTYRQSAYNERLNDCKMDIHEAFYLLKERFPQLEYCKVRNMKYLCCFIQACCVLHNLADKSDIDFDVNVTVLNEKTCSDEDEEAGIKLRNEICESLKV